MTASTIVNGTLIVIYYTVNEQDSFDKLELFTLIRDWSLFMWGLWGGGVHRVGQAYFFLEKRCGPKENFTMIGGGSLCDSVGWASGCHAGGREFDSGQTNTQGLKITE